MARLAGHVCNDGAFLRWVQTAYYQGILTRTDILRLYSYANSIELWFDTVPGLAGNVRARQAAIYACYTPVPPPPPPPAPLGSPQRFVQDFWCYAAYVASRIGWYPELVMATWGVDTGWGAAHGMMSCHAFLGISCSGPGPGYTCTLCNASQCFGCYNSFNDFYRSFISSMGASYYNVVRQQPTLEGQAAALSNNTSFAGGSPSYLSALRGAFSTIASTARPRCG